MSGSDIDALAARAKAGERAAFDALVRREAPGLYAFVRRYVGDADEAYDVTQDAFVAAWRSIGRFDPARPFGAWIRTIALNKCRDQARRAKVRRLARQAFALEPKAPAEPSSREGDENLRRLDAAIARLPAIYKDPLLLTTAGGLSHEAAAAVLNTTKKAVELRLRRASQRLAAMLETATEG